MADKKQPDNKKPAQGQKGGPNQQQNANKAAAGKAAAAEAKAKAASKVELDDGKSSGEKVTIRLRDKFRTDVVPALMKEFNYANPMQVPSIKKVVVNIGLGEAVANAKALDAAVGDLTAITGQRPVINRAKKSIAAFKVRENMQIGASVTLRGPKMYEFLDRLVSVALPRVRDFSGVSNRAFDGHGNYTLGLREQIIFPEIDYDRVDKVRGMEITIVTSAKTDEEGKKLLGLMGMPFRK